jgi:hypothetical protein
MQNEIMIGSLGAWLRLIGQAILVLAIGIFIGVVWGISLDPTCTPTLN